MGVEANFILVVVEVVFGGDGGGGVGGLVGFLGEEATKVVVVEEGDGLCGGNGAEARKKESGHD